MQFGICTDFEQEGRDFYVPHLRFLTEMGFDYLELPLNRIASLYDAEYAGLKAYLGGIFLPVTACNCYMDGSIPLTGPAADPEQYGAYIKKAVERAAGLGVKKLVLGSAGSRNVPPGFPKARAMEQLLTAVDRMTAEMEPYGIELELEHLNRGESNILTRFEETAGIVREKNVPGLKSILDLYHFTLGNENPALICERADAIGHIHYARTLGRTFPTLQDMAAEAEMLTFIRQSEYNQQAGFNRQAGNGTFSMECSFPRMDEEPQEYMDVLTEFKRQLAL